MFSKILLVVPFFVVSSVTARPASALLKRAGDVSLADWHSQSPPLESYWRFKNRYASLGCSGQQGTDFYTSCCYPLTADESLSSRPAECTPTSLTCGAPVVPSAVVTSEAETPTYTPESQDNSDDYYDEYEYEDDADIPICEDPNDDGEWHEDYETQSWVDTYVPEPAPSTIDEAQPAPTDSGSNDDGAAVPDTGNNDVGNSDNNGGNVDLHQGGHATYYYQNGNAGACGDFNPDTAFIGAIDHRYYGDLGQRSSWCGQRVRITNLNNQQTVDITIADACPSCDNQESFDLSVAAFEALAPLSDGYIPIQWHVI